jgi:hypothetical protein
MIIQQVLGTFLYWARSVNPTIIPAISALASEQATSTATETTAEKLTQLLNYCAMNPNGTIQYAASDMVLHIHLDASYLSEPKAQSRIGATSSSAQPQTAITTSIMDQFSPSPKYIKMYYWV